jgi:hypothetical protein
VYWRTLPSGRVMAMVGSIVFIDFFGCCLLG